VLLPFNPGSELAHADNPELVLVGGYQYRPVADSWQFLRSMLYSTRSGRAQHDIRDSSSLFGARACCIMGLAV
jgi:hypothetical protein